MEPTSELANTGIMEGKKPSVELETFSRDDLVDIKHLDSGGENRVFSARDIARGRDVVIKVPNTRALRNSLIDDTQREPYVDAGNTSSMEDLLDKVTKTIRDPEIKGRLNEDAIDQCRLSQIANRISPAVVPAIGVLQLKSGMIVEVQPFVEGVKPSQENPLTTAQREYIDGQKAILAKNGLYPQDDELDYNNCLITGPNPDNVVFVEHPNFISEKAKDGPHGDEILQIKRNYESRTRS
jgi:hypothetical protein